MKELIVISGKGGTGKTSITASLAVLAKNAVIADCDVDAADLHLILEPTIKQRHDFVGGKLAAIIDHRCNQCGKCSRVCEFDAVKRVVEYKPIRRAVYHIDTIDCEGCGVCYEFCPEKAIVMADHVNGQWFVSETRVGTMVHAKLGIAEDNSGKLVTVIRKEAKKIAEESDKELIIVDGPPGIGCPVIASVTGADMVMAVTEPTLSGIHDLERIVKLTAGFKIPMSVCINKADLNPTMTDKIEQFAKENNFEVLGKLSYDNIFTEAQLKAKTVIEFSDGEIAEQIKKLWINVKDRLFSENTNQERSA